MVVQLEEKSYMFHLCAPPFRLYSYSHQTQREHSSYANMLFVNNRLHTTKIACGAAKYVIDLSGKVGGGMGEAYVVIQWGASWGACDMLSEYRLRSAEKELGEISTFFTLPLHFLPFLAREFKS